MMAMTLVERWTSLATAHSICSAKLSKPSMISRRRWTSNETHAVMSGTTSWLLRGEQ